MFYRTSQHHNCSRSRRRAAKAIVFNFRYFFYFAKHETIGKPRQFRENFACFAKQKYAKFRFVSFRTTKIKAKFRFVSQKFSFFSRKFCFVSY
jgi:hypothetical protein